MKIINLDKWNSTYSEIGQTNPIRWQNLRMVENGVFEPVSHKWKCKDFMNEVVCCWNLKRSFSIYGFSVEYDKFFNPKMESMPILLHNLNDAWDKNMVAVNEYLVDNGMPEVTYETAPLESGGAVVFLPLKYLENTLFMSQVTLFIRLANSTQVYQTLQDMCKDKVNKQDQPNLDACFKKPLKDFPEKLNNYLWYYDAQHNCPKDIDASRPIQTSLMHNCGVVNWGWN